MKRFCFLVLLCAALLSACDSDPAPAETTIPTQQMQIANPWKAYASIAEAEAATGLTFPLPDVVAGSYTAESFRVLNDSLMEIIYLDNTFEIIVRMQAGEDLDLSGIYETFKSTETIEINGATVTVKTTEKGCLHLISKDGYSYSLYAPNHYWGDSNADFLSYIY